MSNKMPVPDCRFPNSGVVYHELYHGCALPSLTRDTMPGLSPSAVPSGPNAATDATVSECGTGVLAGAAGVDGTADADVGAGRAGVDEIVLDAAARRCEPRSPDVAADTRTYPPSTT
jgi:hypothetical protein